MIPCLACLYNAALWNHCRWCVCREELFSSIMVFPRVATLSQDCCHLPSRNTEIIFRWISTYLNAWSGELNSNLSFVACEKKVLICILSWLAFSSWKGGLGSCFSKVSIVVGVGTISCESDISISCTVLIGFERTGFMMREANIDLQTRKCRKLPILFLIKMNPSIVITCIPWSLRDRILSTGKVGIFLP